MSRAARSQSSAGLRRCLARLAAAQTQVSKAIAELDLEQAARPSDVVRFLQQELMKMTGKLQVVGETLERVVDVQSLNTSKLGRSDAAGQ